MDVTGARLKTARARQHLADLQGQVTSWLARAGAPQFHVQATDEGWTHVARLVEVPDTPAHWSLVLGDLLHNLRSALDLLAWQAVIAGGGTPGRKTGFPVLSSNDQSRGDKAVTTALKGATPAVVKAVRQLQPYNRCPTRQALRSDALWVLHQLNIEDKHRLLVTCAQVVPTISYNVPEDVVGCTVTMTLQPAGNGAEVLRYSNLPRPVETVEMDPQGELDVWVAETEETAYVSIARLGALSDLLERVIDEFEEAGERAGRRAGNR